MPFGYEIIPRIRDLLVSKIPMRPSTVAFFKSPSGPFTIHYWCPWIMLAVITANIGEIKNYKHFVSTPQQLSLLIVGTLWSGYCLKTTPINMKLAVANVALALTAGYNLWRKRNMSAELGGFWGNIENGTGTNNKE